MLGCSQGLEAPPPPVVVPAPTPSEAPALPPDAAAAGFASILPLAKPAAGLDRGRARRVVDAVLRGPKAVELIRIPWGQHDEPPRDERGFLGYAIEARGAARDPAKAGRMLASFVGYTGDDEAKLPMCFAPHHGLVARTATDRIEVLVCFECARLQVHVDGYDGRFEWSMRDWEQNPKGIDAFRGAFDELFDANALPPAKGTRVTPHGE